MNFFITNGFLDALDRAGKLAPRAAARAKVRIFKLKRYLDGVEHSWRNPDHLRWSHVEQAHHIKSGYPPPEFGAFLSDLEKPVLFQQITGLNDKDEEGYFARFHARRFNLACVVLYTEQPDRRLAFLTVGTLTECNRTLTDLRDAAVAKKVIAELRGLPKPDRTAR
ncbi:hypothetical protein [Roseobacter sinensis]|uniref:hypothetical protein n=1 Tax=Roseobacter sinensis TaxID=2931391 RepID=UPI0021E83F3D|nr:hypothetical protein [Roseobacter sp. WL0113]